MNGKHRLDEIVDTKKVTVSDLWQAIESLYGEIPDIIKIILEFNGFNSFLALKGIRYDDKHEFFSSLESTIEEILNSQNYKDEKRILQNFIPLYQKHFKLKPGHKNLILNLMLEIDKIDVDEFFSKAQDVKCNSTEESQSILEAKSSLELKKELSEYEEYIVEEDIDDETSSYTFLIHNEDSERTYGPSFLDSSLQKRKSKLKRKPDRMYNEEFLAQCINPRKRRVTSLKSYLDNDDGICERFSDLIQQSMQCILTQSQLNKVKDISIMIAKETDTCYNVTCPLCSKKIKLLVVFENNGRYRNYKRSNFERHLRFKHCKEDESTSKIFTPIKIA